MSTTDLDRYLSDEVVREAALAAWPLTGGQDARTEKVRASLAAVLPDIIRQAKAEAWEEGAHAAWERSTSAVNEARYCWRHDGEPANPYRADRIEHDARCPHPKCPGGGLCCCLPEQGGQP